jgi:hypothetical protein
LDDNDIIISITDRLRAVGKEQSTFSVHFEKTDSLLLLPKGSTEKHLEAAAQDCGFEIVRRGSEQASLRKSTRISIA